MGLSILESSIIFLMQGIIFCGAHGKCESGLDKIDGRPLFTRIFFRNLLLFQTYFYVFSFKNKKIHLLPYFELLLEGSAWLFSLFSP